MLRLSMGGNLKYWTPGNDILAQVFRGEGYWCLQLTKISGWVMDRRDTVSLVVLVVDYRWWVYECSQYRVFFSVCLKSFIIKSWGKSPNSPPTPNHLLLFPSISTLISKMSAPPTAPTAIFFFPPLWSFLQLLIPFLLQPSGPHWHYLCDPGQRLWTGLPASTLSPFPVQPSFGS